MISQHPTVISIKLLKQLSYKILIGGVEHVGVVQEIIQNARFKKNNAHITLFDLADAFGGVPHNIIPTCVKYYNIPDVIISYVVNLYSKLEEKVPTSKWVTETFQFKQDTFQGDP